MSKNILESRNIVLEEEGWGCKQLRILKNFAYFLSVVRTGPLPSVMWIVIETALSLLLVFYSKLFMSLEEVLY